MLEGKIIVREATDKDIAKIVDIFKQSFTGSYRYWSIRDLRYTYNIVAEINGQIVGAAELYCRYLEGLGDIGVIYFLAVKPSFRRKGVGKELVKVAENIFFIWKCDYAAASTTSDNKASINLFKKMGYKVLDRKSAEKMGLIYTLYAFEDDVFFLKKLRQP